MVKLHVTLDMRHPGKPLDEVIAWLQRQRDSGFSGEAMVKMGKTTGQRIVLVINEDKDEKGFMLPVPRPPTDDAPRRKMWPERD